MDSLTLIFNKLKEWLLFPLFTLGGTQLTLFMLVYVLLFVVLLLYLSGKIKRWVRDRLLAHTQLDIGARNAIGTMIRYLIVCVGFLVIFQTAGINLTTLSILTGAIGIGLGFGLQNIANNFVSGIIILFEQPIKVGDRIEVGTAEGKVTKIGPRSTTVLTNDNIDIIIPNSKLITDNVVNLSHSSPIVRFRVPVTVASDSSLRQVEELLLQAAQGHAEVLTTPAPSVGFISFGADGLDFELLVWTETMLHRKWPLVSDLNFAICRLFREYGVEVPNPQRDVYIREGMLREARESGGPANNETPAIKTETGPDKK